MGIFYCKYNGTPIFHSKDLIEKRILSESPGFQMWGYIIKNPIDLEKLQHVKERPFNEAWYSDEHPLVVRWSSKRLNTIDEYVVLADLTVELPDNQKFTEQNLVKPKIPFITQQRFNEITSDLDNKNLIVIKFGSEWCPGCEKMLHSMETLSKEGIDNVEFYQVASGVETELSSLFDFKTIPFTIFYKNGLLQSINGKDGYDGALPPKELRELIEKIKTSSLEGTEGNNNDNANPKVCSENGCN